MESHPLNSPWTLYYQKQNLGDAKNEDYASSIHKIGKFDSVEDFWSYYSHLKRPNEINENIEFHIFRNDIRGMWEDEENRSGGKWILFLKKEFSPQLWEKSVLSLIGELIHEDVLGAVIAIREDTDILSFWTRHGRNQGDQSLIVVADSISKALDLPISTQLKFKQHLDTSNRDQQRRLFTYTVGQHANNQRSKRGKQSQNKQQKSKT
ncbi:Eukaryotic translation initiation factor NCBP [Tritrichomonas foetus]|uniref:Eukaryotic translation initiation factor NCBP n=1 Tax=Tritrichomonas foetus TaxID=1144522 RepID=A0A1J4J4U7_9EUKA|nr:Eukaryotic translation initiation factor NCBP [Tritrichomonas foetus]|eukprot:OHS93167.1 Eukaryotic translation initiation factor NCBP [Tritrichomonas foetus]